MPIIRILFALIGMVLAYVLLKMEMVARNSPIEVDVWNTTERLKQ